MVLIFSINSFGMIQQKNKTYVYKKIKKTSLLAKRVRYAILKSGQRFGASLPSELGNMFGSFKAFGAKATFHI